MINLMLDKKYSLRFYKNRSLIRTEIPTVVIYLKRTPKGTYLATWGEFVRNMKSYVTGDYPLNEAKDADGFLLLERTDEPITEGLKTYYVGAAARLMDFFRKAELDQDGNPLFSDEFLSEEE